MLRCSGLASYAHSCFDFVRFRLEFEKRQYILAPFLENAFCSEIFSHEHSWRESRLADMLHVHTYTVVDVEVHNPAVVSHHLHWPYIVNNKNKSQQMSSYTVLEKMRVNFLDNNKACLRSSVVMDVSDVGVVEHWSKASKSYVTCLQGENMLCLQHENEFATVKLKIASARVSKHETYLLGQSTSVAACDFPGVGPVSVLAGLYVTTYKPVHVDASFKLFEKFCSQAIIPVEFHIFFEQIGFVTVSMAYTRDTALTDYIRDDRLKHLAARMLTQEPLVDVVECKEIQGASTEEEDEIMQTYVPWPDNLCDLTTFDLSYFD